MQVFEIHFNPRKKEDLIFDSFYYEPENIYEKRIGHLFMVGELKNALPKNFRFLKNLARVVETKFYSSKGYLPEKSLKESLKAANDFLEKITKEGDVSWIANLSFAVLSLSPRPSKKIKTKKYKLNFTKIGDIKVLLSRNSKILDIGKNLEKEEIEPYPLRVFFNIASGKSELEDRIFVLTKEVYDFFEKNDLIEKISQLPFLNEGNLKGILKEAKKEVSGVLLLVELKLPEKEPPKKLIFKEEILKKFQEISKKILSPLFFLKIYFPKLKFQKTFDFFSKKLVKISFFLKNLIGSYGKNLILIFSLIFLLVWGNFLAKIEEIKTIEETKTRLKEIQEKIEKAEGLSLLEEEMAKNLFLEAWQEILPLTKIQTPLRNEIISKKENVEKKLIDLNKLKIIGDPNLIFEFKPQHLNGGGLPEKIIVFGKKIYFFNPNFENLFFLDEERDLHFLESKSKFSQATSIDEKILFFEKPNKLFSFENEKFGEIFSLKAPFEDSELENLLSYRSNLYFLEKKRGEIIKYQNFDFQEPKIWLNEKTKKATNAKSMAIDEAIWILKEDNKIEKYFKGEFQKAIQIKIFPFPKEFKKIWTSSNLPYLYILEPIQKRIIILNKEGKVIRQFQSEKFDDLKDFAVSEDGKKIYLLNNQKLYQILF